MADALHGTAREVAARAVSLLALKSATGEVDASLAMEGARSNDAPRSLGETPQERAESAWRMAASLSATGACCDVRTACRLAWLECLAAGSPPCPFGEAGAVDGDGADAIASAARAFRARMGDVAWATRSFAFLEEGTLLSICASGNPPTRAELFDAVGSCIGMRLEGGLAGAVRVVVADPLGGGEAECSLSDADAALAELAMGGNGRPA